MGTHLEETQPHLLQKLDPALYDLLCRIREEQILRLTQTYSDFANSEKYKKISNYFFNRIYATEDKIERDEAFNMIYEKLVRHVGYKRVTKVSQLKELNELTDELDVAVARTYQKHFDHKPVNRERYEKAYTWFDRWDLRDKQISLLLETTYFFHRLSHFPMIRMVVQPTRIAAHAMGVEHIMEFFMEGYDAFRSIKNPEPFFEAVEKREKEYIEYLRKTYEK